MRSAFKIKSTRSPVSQLPTTETSSVAAIIESSENDSSTMDRLAVVPKSEGKTTPENPASSAKSAAINALKFALQHLMKAPFPGIGVAAGAILDVINRTQVNKDKFTKKPTDFVQEHGHSRQGVEETDD
jgi:hypothetical protein